MAKPKDREYLRKKLSLLCEQIDAAAQFTREEMERNPRMFTPLEQRTLASTLGAIAARFDPIVERIAARRKKTKSSKTTK